MKYLFVTCLATLALPTPSFAVSYPGIEKNVVMECKAAGSEEGIFVLSDSYTTRGYGALENDPGKMYTLPGRMNRSPGNVYSIQSIGPMTPLSLSQSTGWVDNTKGIYENNNFKLDLRSRNENQIIMIDKKSGTRLVCSVEGDCC